MYDGEPHSIYVENLPSFANVEYLGNNRVDVGTYTVFAMITADGYVPLDLDAKLIIVEAKKFTNLVFNSKEFEYDGQKHSIYVENAPDFAKITYSNNDQYAIGNYTVTATVTGKGYENSVLKATLTIVGKKFTGITFKSKQFEFDYNYHSIFVEGAPDFATVRYENNNKYDIGVYTVTATITAEEYEKLVLKATMEIGHFFKDYEVNDRTLIYDGKYQRIKFNFEDLPYYTDVEYYLNGTKVDEIKVKDIGTYQVSVRLSNTKYQYTPKSFSCTIKVVNNPFKDVDATKSSLKILMTLNIKL